ncbi:MAG: nucleotide exchange factor GrpE [Dehalococcoidales bacterium]|nr:nucleotide exchange factor GrpE [Dehalococcoidales bacterium]
MSDEERATQDEPEVDEVTALNQAFAEEKEKAENYLANWQRAQADFANYKRRSEQEKGELSKFANAQLMLGLLPVLDDLERALGQASPALVDNVWLDGIRLIERKLRAGLEAQGLIQIKAMDEAFDPNFHQAAGYSKGEEGTVVQELQKGYMLQDRVLRPSVVIVGSGEAEEE